MNNYIFFVNSILCAIFKALNEPDVSKEFDRLYPIICLEYASVTKAKYIEF